MFEDVHYGGGEKRQRLDDPIVFRISGLKQKKLR
jgi:hypothetical protein